MLPEQKGLIVGSEQLNSQEKLPPNHKLILAGPAFLMALAISNEGRLGTVLRSTGPLNEKLMLDIFAEYNSIYELLSKIVGKDSLLVSKNSITTGKYTSTGIDLKQIDLPPELSFGAKDLDFMRGFYSCWPRDAYSILNGKVLGNKHAWNDHDYPTAMGPLGEGGKVLSRQNAVLVTPDIIKVQKEKIKDLKASGLKVGVLPFVNPKKQNYEFTDSHIDGHASLIEDKNGKLVLLVADSYSRQGNDTMSRLRQASTEIGAKLIEVADRNLPPLPLNIVQFEDRSIAVSNSRAQDLIFTLSYLVGQDKVFPTEIPLQTIPRLTGGGIRCLTNIIPPTDQLRTYLKVS